MNKKQETVTKNTNNQRSSSNSADESKRKSPTKGKASSTNSRAGGTSIKKPGQTKASLQRQAIALSKKLQHTSLIPDEALCSVFVYLSMSDLLRCCCVCKSWKEVAEIQTLWHKVFRRLPKSCQNLSNKSKTTGLKDWKTECIFCVKESRKLRFEKLSNANNLHSGRKKKAEATKALGTRWLIQINQKGTTSSSSPSLIYKGYADEDFIFTYHNLTARWNNLDEIPRFSRMKTLSLYAVTPLMFDAKGIAVPNSTSTSSYTKTFLIDSPIKSMKLVHQDNDVTLYSLGQLYFGVWSSSLPKDGDIAFIGFTPPIEDLLSRLQYGTSNKIWSRDFHQPISDDVDPSYGCHDYNVRICLRNSRKSFYDNEYTFLKNGEWNKDWLCLSHQSLVNPLYDDFYYDIKEEIKFSWKSTALNGRIENILILDVQLKDCNNQLLWNFSELLCMQKTEGEIDYSNYDVYEIVGTEEHRKISIRVLQDRESKHSTILSLNMLLHKQLINQWFGSKY